ncbi:ester cyclase [Streptomyces sp. NPDC048718]|uniref:nuclear transport factor 2 family protein n=1 Tax=Streptomyces sp. NPDC048718 TaxID=3365587 RepID=UPI00371BF591
MTSQNTALVTDFMNTVWNQGATDLADKYVAEDLIQHNPNLPDGRTALTTLIATLRGRLPQMHFAIERTAADGDLVFVHSLFTPAPGQNGQAVVDIYRIQDGLIAEHWDVHQDIPATTASGHPVV